MIQSVLKKIAAIAALIAVPALAHAFPGEIFKIETVGSEYCGDFASRNFGAKNNVDLWARLDSETQLTVSFTPGFDPGTTFPMTGYFYYTKSTVVAFIGAVHFSDGSFATIRGTAAINKKTGGVTAITGTFIQSGVVEQGCFSSGNFTSKKVQ